jgi:hypothetical protein
MKSGSAANLADDGEGHAALKRFLSPGSRRAPRRLAVEAAFRWRLSGAVVPNCTFT